MSKYVRSKKRVLSICKLKGQVAQRDYLQAQKNVARLEMSREQLGTIADQMLETSDCFRSAILAARLEFRHRLIALQQLQKRKIAQGRQTVSMLQSEAYLSAGREERAEQDVRKARKYSENRLQQNQPHLVELDQPQYDESEKEMMT